ncbi:hypothetical protein Taro_037325 [Colocasia esculenta]|uniref:Uncharacterized protein n=1 Tax=Colocasia esculenta TaxID=4460 RepID=A0A843W9F8_COLES|nr:hypothetical protein [Colocasia esculenta]
MRNRDVCASAGRLQIEKITFASTTRPYTKKKRRASCNNLQHLRTNKAQDGPSTEDRPPNAAGDFLLQHSLGGTPSSGG